MAKTDQFSQEYKKLNPAQKKAVDTLEGPVMVVAGPGTGKTQILALRIGNILLKTDAKADAILCLTFTNSGVRAMKNRLNEYIGGEAHGVFISTFHSFALDLVKEHYQLLGFIREPEILSDEEGVFLVDEILHGHDWQYIRPRINPEVYFSELKQLISILKRERLTPKEFLKSLEEEIKNLKKDPENISSRGENKGKLKKEIENKIDSLGRTREVVEFYRLYEEKKQSLALLDYDDILEYAVKLVESYENVRADIYENFQYVLIDEHQDSSGVQNSFLKAVWGGIEKPNIFVVGDDRQLIYAFSGASYSYFEEFSRIFGKTKIITLAENYRSTLPILSLADDLLKSSLTKEKLKSNLKGNEKVSLNEYTYQRDEIIGAGIYFKNKISGGLKPEDCALLVPRNFQVRDAIEMLRNMGLKVSSGKNISLFDVPEAQSFMHILGIMADPHNSVLLSESLLDKTSGILPLSAHKFLKDLKGGELTLESLRSSSAKGSLFPKDNQIAAWGEKLIHFINDFSHRGLTELINLVGNEVLISESKIHEELIYNVEVIRSFLNIALLFSQKSGRSKNITLSVFLSYLKRLESYGSHVSLATFESDSGIQVMTLHKSKGLQYRAAWIAHMNEEVFMSHKRSAFALPEKIKNHIKERDILDAKRELYVAITRAMKHCTISYTLESYSGGELELASILAELSDRHFNKKDKNTTEKEILAFGPEVYTKVEKEKESDNLSELKVFVKERYADTKISVTMLNNFFECPWKWYYRNFLKLPEVKTKSLILGSAVHGTIEFILKNKTLPSVSVIKEKVKTELEREGVAFSAELKKLIKDGEIAVMHFVEDFYKNLAKDYIPERSLQFKDSRFPNLLMYGRIDLTERLPNGEIIITDFKTGASKTKSAVEKLDEENRLSSHLRQLAMYSYLVAGAEKGKEVSTSRLLYLESLKDDKNALYSIHISKEQIDLLVKDIKDYENLLLSGEWANRPCKNGNGKNTLPAQAGECEYCKMAGIYK